MIAPFIVLAVVALAAAALTGWLLAARAGKAGRDALAGLAATAEQRATAAEARLGDTAQRGTDAAAELVATREATQLVRDQLREATSSLGFARQAATDAELDAEAARTALAEARAEQAAHRAELATLRQQLAADRERGRAQEGRGIAEVQRVLAPLLERERMAGALARLEVGRGTRGELPRLMDAIAKIGEFSSVVLSDDSGLPLAVNQGSEDGETLAGLWSLLLTVADRIARSGAPVPLSVVVHDASNQTILHRLFSSAGSQFLLTAVSRGRSLAPEALDPALGKLERILAGSALAAS